MTAKQRADKWGERRDTAIRLARGSKYPPLRATLVRQARMSQQQRNFWLSRV